MTTSGGLDEAFDPERFFDAFPRFVETSETGRWTDRLNARYLALIHANRDVIAGASVLDLASHDGRFSFAALRNGARRVIGIERESRLVRKANENMEFYGVPRERYEFVLGDMYERIPDVERCEVVFCFGIFYHITDHMGLLTTIAEYEPRTMIIDSNVSHFGLPVVEMRDQFTARRQPPAGAQLEGVPSKAGIDAMLSSFGWTYEYFDWPGSGLVESPTMNDYQAERRVTAVVTCNAPPPELREQAVKIVLERDPDSASQWMTNYEAAGKFGMTPQALAVWVRQAERRGGGKRRNSTPWLADHLDQLATALGTGPLRLVDTEQRVGPFSSDIRAETIAAEAVVIVNQLSNSDHAHLGQCLTYGAGVDARIVIWLLPRLLDEHRSALDWLNERTDERTHFFGVVVSEGRTGDSLPAPVFTVEVRPNAAAPSTAWRGWEVAHAALETLLPGEWTTPQDLAVLAGTSPWWVGRHMYTEQHERSDIHRMLEKRGVPWRYLEDSDGTPRTPDSVRQQLMSEGVRFDSSDRADASQHVDAQQLEARM